MSYVPAAAMPHAKPHDEAEQQATTLEQTTPPEQPTASETVSTPEQPSTPERVATQPRQDTVPPGPRTQPTHAGSSWLPIAAGALALGAVVGSVLVFGRSGEKPKRAKSTRRKPAKKRVSRRVRPAAD